MSKSDDSLRDDLKEEVEKLETLEDYDRVLEEMENQIKELKRIKRRKKKMMELEVEKEEILRKMNKVMKNKHK